MTTAIVAAKNATVNAARISQSAPTARLNVEP
jgi:hypothetical protein